MTPNQQPVYNGRYELRSQIARGGTAQVYLARDLVLDRPVALKVLFPEFASEHSFVERFRREAQAAANLSHPNIVPVFDWGESDRSYFIVMEYVDGEPLSSIIRTQAPLEPIQAASIAADIAKALSYAHRHGVVHRDVKPGNVLITSDGQVKVTDFGIARAIGTDEQVTQTGLVMGTATYFSPEQAQGLAVDGRSDIYALGVVLYEMVTGKPPFTGDNPVSIAYQHVREQPAPPRALVPTLPAALEAIIQQAMAKLPAERYATAQDLQADLDRFERGTTVLANPPRRALADDPSGPPTMAMAAGTTTALPLVEQTRAIPHGGDAAPPSERRTTNRWVAAGVLLLVAIGLAIWFGGRSLGYFGAGKYFGVPNVRGMTQRAAEQLLRQKGLIPHVEAGKRSLTDAGKVSDQQPASGTVRKGNTVVIDVLQPQPNVRVPTVANGTPYSTALATLTHAGFNVSAHRVQATSAGQQQGTVIGERPAGNTTEASGTTVTLDVVQGTNTIPVPNVVNDSEVQAAATLGKNLNVGALSFDFSTTVPKGNVIATSPPVGSKVFPGQAVNLDVSKGLGATIPDVKAASPSQAIQTLNASGFSNITSAYAPTDIAGYVCNVLYTNPAAGRMVAPGSKVELIIGYSPSGNTCATGNSGSTSTSSTSTSTPGNSGTVPGNSGTAPGNSGTTPSGH